MKYDYIIIDCAPARSLLTVNALTAADYVLSTILLDVLSIQGLMHIVKTIQEVKMVLNQRLEFLGVLAINVDLRRKLSKEVIDFVKDNYDFAFFETSIRTNVKIAEAPSHGKSVVSYAPRSNGAKDYRIEQKKGSDPQAYMVSLKAGLKYRFLPINNPDNKSKMIISIYMNKNKWMMLATSYNPSSKKHYPSIDFN